MRALRIAVRNCSLFAFQFVLSWLPLLLPPPPPLLPPREWPIGRSSSAVCLPPPLNIHTRTRQRAGLHVTHAKERGMDREIDRSIDIHAGIHWRDTGGQRSFSPAIPHASVAAGIARCPSLCVRVYGFVRVWLHKYAWTSHFLSTPLPHYPPSPPPRSLTSYIRTHEHAHTYTHSCLQRAFWRYPSACAWWRRPFRRPWRVWPSKLCVSW